MTHLQLVLADTKYEPLLDSVQHPLEPLYNGSRIESLVVEYYHGVDGYHRTLRDFPSDLSNLQSVTLKQGRFMESILIAFLRGHSTLERVSLVQCTLYYSAYGSSALPGAPLINEDTYGTEKNIWDKVFSALKELPRLAYLNLDRVGRTTIRRKDLAPDPVLLDQSMTQQATWLNNEIATGLQWLLQNPGYIWDHDLERGHPFPSALEYAVEILDLRWANFKVSSRYWWTPTEITALRRYRTELIKYGFYKQPEGSFNMEAQQRSKN